MSALCTTTEITSVFPELWKDFEASDLKGWPRLMQIMDSLSSQSKNILKNKSCQQELPFLIKNLQLHHRLRGNPSPYLGSLASDVEERWTVAAEKEEVIEVAVVAPYIKGGGVSPLVIEQRGETEMPHTSILLHIT